MILGGFPHRFFKCSFHFWSLFYWLATFSFTLEVFFFPFTLFTASHENRDCLFIFYRVCTGHWHTGESVRQWPGRSGFNPKIESYQRLKKWYLMPPCLTLSIIRYGSRVKWSNSGKGVVPSPTPRCSTYRKGSLRVILDFGRQLYLLIC